MESTFLQTDLFMRLFVAVIFGVLLGAERNFAHKTAGMRTYGLVSLGSAMFVVVGIAASLQYVGLFNFDPLRIASQIVVGVGFLGGGLIVFRNGDVNNLTTSAGLWVAAGVGMFCGFGFYLLAGFATILTLLVFTVLWYFEQKVKHASSNLHEGMTKNILQEKSEEIQ